MKKCTVATSIGFLRHPHYVKLLVVRYPVFAYTREVSFPLKSWCHRFSRVPHTCRGHADRIRRSCLPLPLRVVSMKLVLTPVCSGVHPKAFSSVFLSNSRRSLPPTSPRKGSSVRSVVFCSTRNSVVFSSLRDLCAQLCSRSQSRTLCEV